MRYFWDPPGKKIGLKADIERHRKERIKLETEIAKREQSTDPMAVSFVRTFRHFRCQLEQSFAEIVPKIGRKKK